MSKFHQAGGPDGVGLGGPCRISRRVNMVALQLALPTTLNVRALGNVNCREHLPHRIALND